MKQDKTKIEPGSKIGWGSKFPFFMAPNSIFDMDIQITAYERAGHVKGVNGKAVVTREIKPAEMLVYFYLARCCNAGSQDAFPSYSTIARKCRLGHSTVFDAVDALTRSGLIIKKNRQKKIGQRVPNHYLLMHPEDLVRKDSELTIPPGGTVKPTIPPGGNDYTARRDLKILSYKDKDQQQPTSDLTSIVDRGSHEKSVVVEGTSAEVISASEPPASEEIQELIDYAKGQEPREIILDIQHAGEIIQKTGGLGTAKEKIEAASAFIAKELKAGRKINTIKGIMNHVMKLDTGGIKLGRSKLDERKKRLAEKEDKYRDLYVT